MADADGEAVRSHLVVVGMRANVTEDADEVAQEQQVIFWQALDEA